MTDDPIAPYRRHEPPPILNRDGLPVPRLELAFVPLPRPDAMGYNGYWFHRLVLQHLEGFVHTLVFDVTRTDAVTVVVPSPFDCACLPFRAGVQVRWDQHHLKTPAFLVVGDAFFPIPPLSDADLTRIGKANARQAPTPR